MVTRTWKVSVSVIVIVPPLVVVLSTVPVLVVSYDETVPVVVTPVSVTTSLGLTVELVEELVLKGEVNVVVLVLATEPVVVVVVTRVLVIEVGSRTVVALVVLVDTEVDVLLTEAVVSAYNATVLRAVTTTNVPG